MKNSCDIYTVFTYNSYLQYPISLSSGNARLSRNSLAGGDGPAPGPAVANVSSASVPARKRADIGKSETSADKTKWTRIPEGNPTGRRNSVNVLTETAGPTGLAIRQVDPASPSSALRLFVNEPMLRLVKKYTELEARRVLSDDSWTVSLEELDAFIAILYIRGAFRYSALPFGLMWDSKWGIQIVRDIMPRNRATEILKFLRFDDKRTRQQRREADKFCLVSELWNRFIESCISYYKPNENITVDEQLYPTKVRCPFLQYMANKPDKFGIKFWMLCDSKERFVLNAMPYLGKDDARPRNCPLGEHVVMSLCQPYLNKGRNVTCDNFFTSLKLGDELRKKKTTLVGTLNRGKREVPPSVKNPKDPVQTTVLYKTGDTILTSYQGKPNKNVLVLSTLHTGVTISEGPKKLPDSVEYYNMTKCGVDTVDQMARKYTVRAGTRRWPVHVFYNILDLSMINAHTMFKLVTKSNISRHTFICKVAEELAAPHIEARRVGGVGHAGPPLQGAPSRSRCQVKLCKDNKTKQQCDACKKPMCGSCQSEKKMCKLCSN